MSKKSVSADQATSSKISMTQPILIKAADNPQELIMIEFQGDLSFSDSNTELLGLTIG